MEQLKINEIFFSIQGEGLSAGLPCIFIRTSGCPLRCRYCDTKYAYYEGKMMSVDEIIQEISAYNCKLVEVTGGEPLAQPQTPRLLQSLIDRGYETLLETSGSFRLDEIPVLTKKIVDFKTPSSGEEKRNCYDVIQDMNEKDEIKFVIGNEEDFDWMEKIIQRYKLTSWPILVSPEFSPDRGFPLVWIADRVKHSHYPLRLQLQLHKFIYPGIERGV